MIIDQILIDTGARVFVLLAAATALAPLLRRATPAARHLYWQTALIAALALPLLTLVSPRWMLLQPAALTTELTGFVASSAAARAGVEPAEPTRVATPIAPAAVIEPVLDIMPALWMGGCGIVAAFFAIGYLQLARIRRHSRRASLEWAADVTRIARRLGIRHEPEVLLSEAVPGPITTGWLNPVLLVPAEADAWSAARREAVVAHELAHVARHDCRAQLVAQAVCALHWFNPLAWRAALVLRRERERACDAAALGLGLVPSSYAGELLAIAASLGHRRAPSVALAMARRSELEGRLVAVLSDVAPRRSMPARAVTMTAIAALAVGVSGARLGGDADAALQAALPAQPPIVESMASGGAPRASQQAAPTPQATPAPQAKQQPQSPPAPERTEGLDALLGSITDIDAQVREKAALAIGLWADDRATDALIAALRDPDGQVREKAAIGLALGRRPAAVGALIAAAGDPDPQVREKVVIALGVSGDERAWPVLTAAANDPDPQVREKVPAALMLMKSGSLGTPESELIPAIIRKTIEALNGLVK